MFNGITNIQSVSFGAHVECAPNKLSINFHVYGKAVKTSTTRASVYCCYIKNCNLNTSHCITKQAEQLNYFNDTKTLGYARAVSICNLKPVSIRWS